MAKKTTRPAVKTTTRKTKTAPKRAAPKSPARPAPQTVTPYLAVNDAAAALDWYRKVFNAKETQREMAPGNKIMHAAITIGGSQVYVSDIFPGSDLQDPTRMGPSVNLSIWSPKIDQFWQNAIANGAKVTMPLEDQFWGDRYGKVIDPFGHSWAFMHKSKLSKEALEAKRVEAMKQFASMGQ